MIPFDLIFQGHDGSEMSAHHSVSLPFGHSDECPSFHGQSQSEVTGPDIRVAVCVAVVCNGQVLLTRRAATMRTFPERWVFPGGHVDHGESLEEAGIREVREETGLVVDSLTLLGLWESWYVTNMYTSTSPHYSYPTYLEQGKLLRQHIVVYYQATLSPVSDCEGEQNPLNSLVLEALETDMAAWVPLNVLEIFESEPDTSIDSIVLLSEY